MKPHSHCEDCGKPTPDSGDWLSSPQQVVMFGYANSRGQHVHANTAGVRICSRCSQRDADEMAAALADPANETRIPWEAMVRELGLGLRLAEAAP